jgi:integration host factor subunit beta
MNKSDLITAITEKGNPKSNDAAAIINLVFNGFTDVLKKSGRIEIRGFGSFCGSEYKSYSGRNTKTGKKIAVKPKGWPFFKVAPLKNLNTACYDDLVKSQNSPLTLGNLL